MSITYHKKLKRLRKHGFLYRMSTTEGRNIINARRRKKSFSFQLLIGNNIIAKNKREKKIPAKLSLILPFLF